MAILTDVSIDIGGTSISDYLNISLSQQTLMHHHLHITIRKDLIDKDSIMFKDSQNLIGKPVKMSIKSHANQGEVTEFTGVVYELKTIRSNQYSGDLIQIHALSPEFQMADAPNFRSFEDKPLNEIIKTVIGDYTINNIDVAGSANTQLHYTVQFNENGFDFVRRLAIRHGQWFLYDGKTLRFGSLPQKSTKLEFGKDLFDFEFSIKMNAFKYEYVTQDYMLDKAETSKPTTPTVSKISKPAYDASDKVYKNTSNHFYQGSFYSKPSKSEQDTIVNLNQSSGASNLMICQGSSDDPNLILGGSIEIQEKDVNHGKFIVVQLNHYCDRNGNYKNDFKAIPIDVKIPPYTNPDIMVFSEPHSAKVTDNHDPDGLSRIRAQFYWGESKKYETPWMRCTTPYAGKEKGFHFIPEIGEEVLVGFESGNPERPYVLGTLYHGKAMPDSRWQTDKNDFKAIRSRSGHTIEMIDKDGAEEIKIYDGSPTSYNYSVTLASHSKKIIVEAKGDMEIKADNIKVTANQNFELKANNIKQNADSNVDITANSNVTIKATTKMSLDGGTQLDQKASAKAAVNGGGQLELKGGMVKIN
jgi:type VI secretion system secreted protein VgrG